MTSFDINSLSNCFSTLSTDSSLQTYFKSFNDEVTLQPQELSNDGLIFSGTSDVLDSFVTTIVQNELNDDIEFASVVGFNAFENVLDHEDLGVFPPIEQTGDECYDDIGYNIISSEELSQNSYYDLDNTQSIMTYLTEAESISQTFEEVLQIREVPFITECKEIIQPKKSIEKEKKSKRGRGRPPIDLSKLQKKVIEAEKSNDKHKARITKNNKASKEYRDRKAAKKQQLDMALALEADNYRKLKKIHTKMSLRIKQLEKMIKRHTF